MLLLHPIVETKVNKYMATLIPNCLFIKRVGYLQSGITPFYLKQ